MNVMIWQKSKSNVGSSILQQQFQIDEPANKKKIEFQGGGSSDADFKSSQYSTIHLVKFFVQPCFIYQTNISGTFI